MATSNTSAPAKHPRLPGHQLGGGGGRRRARRSGWSRRRTARPPRAPWSTTRSIWCALKAHLGAPVLDPSRSVIGSAGQDQSGVDGLAGSVAGKSARKWPPRDSVRRSALAVDGPGHERAGWRPRVALASVTSGVRQPRERVAGPRARSGSGPAQPDRLPHQRPAGRTAVEGSAVRIVARGPRRPASASPSSSVAPARGRSAVERLGDPAAVDQPLEQRVGGQPVGPVQAGAGDLADGVQARAPRCGPTSSVRTPPIQ